MLALKPDLLSDAYTVEFFHDFIADLAWLKLDLVRSLMLFCSLLMQLLNLCRSGTGAVQTLIFR